MINFEDLKSAKENFKQHKNYVKEYQKNNYTNIKFLKGKAIDTYKKELRNGTKGVSTENYGNVWFYLEKGKAIFKDYDGYQNSIKRIRMTNELLCYELSKQMGVLCAEYELAHYQEEYGVVSYDVAKPDEELLSLNQVCDIYRHAKRRSMENILEVFKKFELLGYKVNKKQELKRYYKMALFDSLTAQSDRNINNIFLIKNEKEKTIKLAPLIDNEFAFNAQNLNRHFENSQEINTVEMRKYLNYIYKTATVSEMPLEDSLYRETISQLVSVAKQNKSYEKILKQQLEGFDVKKALQKLEKQGIKVGEKYTQYLLKHESMLKNLYKLELKKQQQNQKNETFGFIK